MEVETEMEMGEGTTWKELFQRRVVMADAHCDDVNVLLHGMVVVACDQHERRDMVAGAGDARRTLESASAKLGLAVANMGAARHLALRCGAGAPSPRTPLPSVDGLADPDARRALDLLQDAAELVNHVHDKVEGARGHLSAAELLLVLDEDDDRDAPCPWVQPPWEAEQLDGLMDLGEALSKAIDLVALTAAAREAAFGFGDN